MSNQQLWIAVGVPLLFNSLTTVMLYVLLTKRIDDLQDAFNQRLDDMRDLWRAELRRVEEVLDARLKSLEEHRRP